MLKRLFAIIGLVCISGTATAHPAPFSYLDVYLDASSAHGALVIHDFDAAHELGLSQADALLDPAVASRYRETLTRIVGTRLQISADAHPVQIQWNGIEVLATRQSLRLPFELTTAAPGKLDINALLFPYDAAHQTFINLYERGQLKHQAILDAKRRTLSYYSGGLQGRWAVVKTFVQAGIHHILIGPDHILFLLGLLLLGGSWLRLTSIVTAFTLGHSITLSLAALGLVRIAPSVVEPAIALSIVVVGVDNLLVNSQQRIGATTHVPPRDLRPWLAGGFGLIHGFGFAAVLLELGLPRAALGWSLAAFNVGVEIGQLAIVVVLAAGMWTLQRYSMAIAARCVQLGSMLVIAAGAYWFVQRVWFTSAA